MLLVKLRSISYSADQNAIGQSAVHTLQCEPKCHWSFCSPAICYSADQNFKSKCSFYSILTLFISKKRFNESYHITNQCQQTLRTWSSFQILTCGYLKTNRTKKLNRNLTKEKDYSSTKLSLYEILWCDYTQNVFCSTFAFQCHFEVLSTITRKIKFVFSLNFDIGSDLFWVARCPGCNIFLWTGVQGRITTSLPTR